MQAGTRFTYPEGMEGWVDLADLIACDRKVASLTPSLGIKLGLFDHESDTQPLHQQDSNVSWQ